MARPGASCMPWRSAGSSHPLPAQNEHSASAAQKFPVANLMTCLSQSLFHFPQIECVFTTSNASLIDSRSILCSHSNYLPKQFRALFERPNSIATDKAIAAGALAAFATDFQDLDFAATFHEWMAHQGGLIISLTYQLTAFPLPSLRHNNLPNFK